MRHNYLQTVAQQNTKNKNCIYLGNESPLVLTITTLTKAIINQRNKSELYMKLIWSPSDQYLTAIKLPVFSADLLKLHWCFEARQSIWQWWPLHWPATAENPWKPSEIFAARSALFSDILLKLAGRGWVYHIRGEEESEGGREERQDSVRWQCYYFLLSNTMVRVG